LTMVLAACGISTSTEPPASPAPPSAPAPAPAPAPIKFPERDITFVVPYSPGGGYDTLARGLAPYIQKYLPNRVNVIVENRGGAAGQTGTTYVYNARPDGYTIMLSNVPGLIAGQIISDRKNYDLSEFTWLGRVTVVNNGLAVAGNSKYLTVDDLKQGELLFAGADIGDAATAFLAFAQMGIKARYLPHNGSGEATTSVLRGDAAITYFSLGSLLPYVTSGDLRVLVQFNEQPMSGLIAPTSASLGHPNLSNIAAQQRVIGAPPKVPKEIAAILEEALKKAVTDPEFVAFATGIKQPTAWMSGQETSDLVNAATKMMQDNSAILIQNLGGR